MQVNWLNILGEEVEKAGSIQAVADQLGYSRTAVSRALIKKYPGGTDKIRAKVIATFCDRIICVHSNQDMSQTACIERRTRPMPQSDPEGLDHWASCQFCPNNPDARPNPKDRLARRIEKAKEPVHA